MIRTLKLFAGASLALLALSAGGAANGQPPRTDVLGGPQPMRAPAVERRSLSIPRGKAANLDFSREMRIGGATDPRIADIRMVTPTHATVLGIGYGQTDVQFYDQLGRLAMVFDVRVEQDIRSLEDSLNKVVPQARIQAQAINDSIILTGQVANAAEADRAVQVASVYSGSVERVRNLLTITGKDQVTLRVQAVEVNRSIMKQLGFDTNFLLGQLGMPQYVLGNTPSYAVNGGFQGGGAAGYQINTTSQPVANAVSSIARVAFGNSGINTTNLSTFVDSFLRGASTLTASQTDWVQNYVRGFANQINVVDQTGTTFSMTDVGITPQNFQRLSTTYLSDATQLTAAQRAWFTSFFGELPRQNTNYIQNLDSTLIDPSNKANPVVTDRVGSDGLNQGRALIQAFERQGLVRTLAEPTLTAVSGEASKFLAGGEFPVPTGRDAQGNVTIEFKPFGVGLGFTPVVLSDGRISLKISTEVSELSTQGALTLSGLGGVGTTTVIPALSVRRVENTIELPSGGSMMVAGLLQEQTRQNIDKIPGVADMPVIGPLARSRDYINNQTELVIIVTAYLTTSTSRDKLQTPADGLRIASDAETMFFGKLNTAYKVRPEATQGRTYQGPYGHVID